MQVDPEWYSVPHFGLEHSGGDAPNRHGRGITTKPYSNVGGPAFGRPPGVHSVTQFEVEAQPDFP